MRRSTIAIALFLGLQLPATVFANNAVTDAAYHQIHTTPCSAMDSSCRSLVDENEKFAFVAMWCERHPEATTCIPLKTLKGGPAVIAFNHDTQAWRAIYGLTDDQISSDKDGNPTVLTSSGRTVVAVVESTNPLLYQAVAGTVTETDPEVIAKLQKLFEQLAPILQKQVVGQGAPIIPDVEVTAAKSLIESFGCAVTHWKDAALFAERVERHRAGDYKLVQNACAVSKDSAQVKFDALDNFLQNHPCGPAATALRDALRTADPDSMATKARSVTIDPKCSALGPIQTRIVDISQDIKAAQNNQDRDRARAQGDGDLKDLTTALDIIDAVTQATSAESRTKIEDVLAKFDLFEERVLSALATDKQKTNTSTVAVGEIADFLIVPRGTITVSADKIRTRTLTVSKSSPFDRPITKRPDSVSSSYAAESLYLSLVDVTAAMTISGLSAPVFGAVTVPAATTEHPDATKKVIAKTDEEKRSGKIAMFVEFPFITGDAPLRKLGGQIGVGVDKDLNSLFAGLAFRATRALHIGAGMTWQTVKALDGQKIGDPITADTDIKKKDSRDHSWYVSFNFSLGSLSLFKGN